MAWMGKGWCCYRGLKLKLQMEVRVIRWSRWTWERADALMRRSRRFSQRAYVACLACMELANELERPRCTGLKTVVSLAAPREPRPRYGMAMCDGDR